MKNVRIEVLTQKHIDEASCILARNFSNFNPIWKKYNLKEDDITVLMRGKLIKALEIDQSFVMYENDKMIAVNVFLDVLDYMDYPAMPNNLEFTEKIKVVGQKLDGLVNLSQLKKGQCIYGTFVAIDSTVAGRGYFSYFFQKCLTIFKAVGWKQYYARTSNIAIVKVLQKMGGKQIAVYELINDDQVQKFVLMRIDLQDFKLKSAKQKQKNIKKTIKISPKL